MEPQRPIYLDNAATTRVCDPVAELVMDCMTRDYGNPSSAHHLGIAAEKQIRGARAKLLAAIGDSAAAAGDVIWTSGGTESDALGVAGAARARARRGKHIVVSAIEHPAVRESARQLEQDGWRVTEVAAETTGTVDPARVADAVDAETTVVAIMRVNNEIGTVLPIADIARAVRERAPNAHIHCDAVQALGKIPVDVHELGSDSVAFAAHKIHGPKGVGALWLRHDARLAPMWAGGGQQRGIRSGTQNVPGIAGLGEAARRSVEALADTTATWQRCEQILLSAAERSGVEFRRNGDGAECAPHVVSLAFADVPAEPLLHVLESRGILVSAGSACSERDRKPSPVLQAIAVPPSFGTVRLSFGRDTTESDVELAAGILVESIRSLL